jgi:hypothetical protein
MTIETVRSQQSKRVGNVFMGSLRIPLRDHIETK